MTRRSLPVTVSTFTLRRLPGVSDEDFARDAGLVQADLTRLKQVLEAPGA